MIILIGKSASGKDTVVKKLVQDYGYHKIVTWTTRPMRPGEKQDITYHFTDENSFKEKINEGFFAEWKKYESVFGTWYYGTALLDIESFTDENRVIIVTPDGYKDLRKYLDNNTLVVYLDVKNRILKKRLKKRGDNIKEIKRRLKHDNEDFKGIKDIVHVVVENNHRDINEIAQLIHKMHELRKKR